MTDLSERLARLTPAQRTLLDRRLRAKAAPAPGPPPVARRPVRDSHALTVDQERIWLIHQFDPADPAYNVFFADRLVGPLDVAAIRAAVADFVTRHEALRTTFQTVDGRPRAIVHDRLPVGVEVTDLRHLPRAEREPAALALAEQEVSRPFDLVAGPLLRVRLLRTGDEENLMVGTVDHLVWDRASLGIFNAEFAELYSAHATGRAPQLPPIELQFGDYAEWQPSWLRTEVAARHLPYWRERLAGAPAALELPTDRPRPAMQTFRGARYQFRLTPRLSDAVRRFAATRNVTVNVALLAAWIMLLHRLSGQDDIVVGTTSSTRGRPETDRMVGYFLTMLPLRVHVRPEMTFRELVQAARDTVVGAFDHHDVPFGALLDGLDVPRDPSRAPLFSSTFIFVDFVHEDHHEPHGLRAEAVMLDNHTAKDDITLGFFDDRSLAEDHYYGLLEYNTDLFDEPTVVGISKQLIILLEQAVADADRRVDAYALMAPDETRRLLVGWNDTAVPRDSQATVDRLVLDQAARTPDRTAVRCGEEHLTYAQLVARAEAIAAALRARGAGPKSVVGVCLDRSGDLVAALLGVLLAEAAYLPLDPSHPQARLAEVARSAGAGIIVTTAADGAALDPLPVIRVTLDDVSPPAAGTPAKPQPQPREPDPLAAAGSAPVAYAGDRLAYVMYTSGSTGTPKGVEVTHGNLLNLLLDMAERLPVGPADVLAAVTPLTFDIAGLELWLPLLRGACVQVVPREVAQDGARLAEQLAACRATVLQATPATWQLLLDAGWTSPDGLTMVVGGEALSPELARALAAMPGRAWNVYGPTETTIWSTAWPIEPGSTAVSIGRPLANTTVYVLDSHQAPVPVGVPGDLYIGGAGVSRGYRAAPELTAARFVPDPFAGSPSARMYRTGDRARWRRDGTLVFLGRDDHQVKLRGYRIELGEIEARLEQQPLVRRAVAVVREDRPGDRRIVAYVEPAAGGDSPDPGQTRERLRNHLPDYMLPAIIVVLPELPLTANGKLDRRSLPPPSTERAAGDYESPRDQTELTVARIWEDVLDVRPVGIRDRFFDLGGHSLQVLRLMGEMESRFGVRLPMAAIFQGATVEAFARMLRDGVEQPTGVHAVRLRDGRDGSPPLFFLHPAGSEVVCYMPFAEHLPPERPLYALASPPPVDGRAAHATFEERATDFARLIRELQPEGHIDLVGWCYGGSNAYATAVALERAGVRVAVTLVDAHPPQPVEEEPDAAEIAVAIAANMRWEYLGDEAATEQTIERLRQLGPTEHVEFLLDIARAGGYLPADSGRAQVEALLEMWTANLRLLWRYHAPTLHGPVTVVRGTEENPAAFESWQRLALGPLRILTSPGNHYTVVRSPNVRQVAAIIADGWSERAEPDAERQGEPA
ncbi:non-ribosomal peptide synthetase [Frankia gtarii]|uniref:non-ribosomal peptide synthetase n=1 Tax=Frankia gtarii TaxID=2950102 RepID=UPI0021C1D805|nr:amino acid adenylation domain-containing protein [Frankia gtarii]